jgi:hypothetical protein
MELLYFTTSQTFYSFVTKLNWRVVAKLLEKPIGKSFHYDVKVKINVKLRALIEKFWHQILLFVLIFRL